MTSLILTLVFRVQTPATDVMERVAKAHAGFSKLAYTFKLVEIALEGGTKVLEFGTLDYHRNGTVLFKIRDNFERVNARASRDKSGHWEQSASDDVHSTNPANNALGYPDSFPSKWSYVPVRLLEKEELGSQPDWDANAKEVSFRSTPCFLLTGRSLGQPVKVWVEKKRLVLIRVESQGEHSNRVTVFERIKI